MVYSKAKQIILNEIYKLKRKAKQKRYEAERLEAQAAKLQEEIDKL